MKEDKKIYPSQLNTKSIACRVPIEDYVMFLNESISQGIRLNDWLLRKIYGQTINNLKESVNGLHTKENTDLIFTDDDLIEAKGDWILSDERYSFYKRFILNKRLDKKELLARIDTLLVQVMALKEQLEEPKIADIDDVKNQLTILIDNTFRNPKDRRDYRKDLFGLLGELENDGE